MIVQVTIGVVTILYPLAIYFGLQRFEPSQLVLLLVMIAAARLFSRGHSLFNHWLWLGLLVLLCLWTFISNSELSLKLYPVLVSGGFLVVFLWSLLHPPTTIERLARLQHPDLPEKGVRYTRTVTKVWCAFFLLNGSIALAIALFGSDALWALYNGLISYLCVGTLFAVEWLVRRRVMNGPP